MIGVTASPDPLVIVSEMCAGGSLYNSVMSSSTAPTLIFVKNILIGISHGTALTLFQFQRTQTSSRK